MNIISKSLLLALGFGCFAVSAHAQGFKSIINDAKKNLGNVKMPGTGTTGGNTSLTQSEIASGLKEALKVGTQNATSKVSAVNGFFGNQLIKVLLPPEAKKVETTLRALGMGAQVDRAILSMHRLKQYLFLPML